MPATRQEPAHQEQPSARPEVAEDAAGDISAVFPLGGSMQSTESSATKPRASTARQPGKEIMGLRQENTTAVQQRLLDKAKDKIGLDYSGN